MRLRCLSSLFGLVVLSLFTLPRSADAAAIVYDVTGWIDTTDDLFITGANLHWEHPYSGSPAGTHGATEQPTVISSSLNGVAQMTGVNWSGMWTGFSVSKTFTPLVPALPNTAGLLASVEQISGRGSLSITQQPALSNNYTLIVQFKDGFNGAAFLDAKITVVPEPALPALSLLGLIRIRRRR